MMVFNPTVREVHSGCAGLGHAGQKDNSPETPHGRKVTDPISAVQGTAGAAGYTGQCPQPGR